MAISLAALAATTGWIGRVAAAEDPCAPWSYAVGCDVLPSDPDALHDKLRSLDVAARAAIADRQPATAARLFECLLIADPRPGHAANLAIALREAGDLRGALSAARCAERLTTSDSPGAVRARARREELERLLADRARVGQNEVASPVSPIAPDEARTPRPARDDQTSINLRPRRAPFQPVVTLTSVPAPPTPPPPEHHRSLVRGATAALVGAVLLAGGSTVAYLTARTRAEQFDEAQNTEGYTARAQSLRSSAGAWEAASIGGFVAAAAAGVTAYLTW